MTRRARGRLNKKKAYMGEKWKRKAEGRKKKKTYRNCLEGELKCNFHIISHGQSSNPITPSFFAYHIRIILCPVPSFCSLWTADVFRVVASLPPKFRRERSDDRKYVCSSQANLSANMKVKDRYR